MKVAVVASGDLGPGDLDRLAEVELVIAADGGAGSLAETGRRPDLIVGDLDSADAALVERLAAAGTRILRHPADKDASDTELAVEEALAAGATEIVLLGALGGGRLDHELANLLLLADPALAGLRISAVRSATSVRVAHGGDRLALEGAIGDVVTLLPIGGDARAVSAEGVRWPLDAATLVMGRSRGLSNVITAPGASVSLERGSLLVVVTRTTQE
jgi:thiamine pyrophosphokinase